MPDQNNAIPGFHTLWWDNIKTTGFWGGMTGICVSALPGSIAGALVGAPEAVKGGAAVTIILFGIPLGVVAGAFSSVFFSLPFTVVAQYTRDFKKNNQISETIEELRSIRDDYNKAYIIKKIVESEAKSFRIRSYESQALLDSLTEIKKGARDPKLDTAWQAII